MKFGFNIPAAPDPQAREPLRQAFETCARAEELGFDFGVVAQHRFTAGYPLSPWVTLGALAARTSSLRLGTSIMLLPLDHPLDVAEEVATVDRISAGRVFLGAGLGYRPYEYAALQKPYDRRGALMSECLDVVQRAWTQDRFSFHGQFFSFDDVERRAQAGAAAAAADLARRQQRGGRGPGGPAGRRLAGRPRRPASCRRRPRGRVPGAGGPARPSTVCLLRLVGIGVSRAAVERDWLPDVVEMLRGYRRAGAPGEKSARAAATAGDHRKLTLDGFGDMLIAGTPDDCVRQLRQCAEQAGCEYVLATFRGPDADRQLDLFGREVIPAVG